MVYARLYEGVAGQVAVADAYYSLHLCSLRGSTYVYLYGNFKGCLVPAELLYVSLLAALAIKTMAAVPFVGSEGDNYVWTSRS